MKLYYNWFESPQRPDFKRMKDVFEFTVRKFNPEIEIIEECSKYPDPKGNLRPVHYENVYKLRQWNDFVQGLTEPALLTDCDMMCIGDLSEIEKVTHKKDVYFTTRSRDYSNVRCNAGVVYVKPTKEAKEFFKRWLKASEEFNPDDKYWFRMLQIYKGATQTALASIWDNNQAVIGELPCLIWNATVFEWEYVDPELTKLVHIKSNLRLYILENYSAEKMGAKDREYLLPLQQQWFQFENEMRASS